MIWLPEELLTFLKIGVCITPTIVAVLAAEKLAARYDLPGLAETLRMCGGAMISLGLSLQVFALAFFLHAGMLSF